MAIIFHELFIQRWIHRNICQSCLLWNSTWNWLRKRHMPSLSNTKTNEKGLPTHAIYKPALLIVVCQSRIVSADSPQVKFFVTLSQSGKPREDIQSWSCRQREHTRHCEEKNPFWWFSKKQKRRSAGLCETSFLVRRVDILVCPFQLLSAHSPNCATIFFPDQLCLLYSWHG